MNFKNLIFILLFGAIIAWSWQKSTVSMMELLPHADAVDEFKEDRSKVTRPSVIKDLPCFKCHIYERFTQEPSPGIFSHALHIQFEYHCNQCHSFHGHRQMVINTDICTSCHEEVPKVAKR
jgi:hypothetical protein